MRQHDQRSVADEHTVSSDNLPGSVAGLSATARHRVLAHRHRRILIELQRDGPVPRRLDDLAVAVATADAEDDTPDPGVVEHLEIALHHSHLPMLSDLGILEYDPDSHRVE